MSVEHNLNWEKMVNLQQLKMIQISKELDKIDVYFKETLVDSEAGSLDVIEASPICTMVKPDNFIFGAPDRGNNWTKVHHIEGAQLIDGVFDMIRKEGESCGDCPQEFKITHSLGEGIGLGLMKMTHNYVDKIRVYPSPIISDVVLEFYNTTLLSIDQLLESIDEIFVIDNETDILKQQQPRYGELNWVISLIMSSGIAAWLQFSDKLNSDLPKIGINLVSFQGLDMFGIAQAPLFAPHDEKHVKVTYKSKRWYICISIMCI